MVAEVVGTVDAGVAGMVVDGVGVAVAVVEEVVGEEVVVEAVGAEAVVAVGGEVVEEVAEEGEGIERSFEVHVQYLLAVACVPGSTKVPHPHLLS